MSRRSAMALAEVIVSASVLLVMLGLASLALTAYMRGTQQLFRQPFPAHEVARALTMGSRLARGTQVVLWPTRQELADYRPSIPARGPLVLVERTANGSEIVGLTFEPERKRLVKLIYPSAFDATQPYPPNMKSVELGPCSGISVRLEGEQLRLTLQAGPEQLPWTTSVDFHGVPVP